jgi:hypothetical protein
MQVLERNERAYTHAIYLLIHSRNFYSDAQFLIDVELYEMILQVE